jgi:hypothetical protein
VPEQHHPFHAISQSSFSPPVFVCSIRLFMRI